MQPMSPRWILAMVALCALTLASSAQATLRTFVLAGGSAIKAEKTDLNEWQDKYTIREHGGSWEAGGGLRILPRGSRSTSADRSHAVVAGESPIEMRLRFTYGGGNLPDTRFRGRRFSGSIFSYPVRSFPVSSHETFTYRSWSVGGFFSARVFSTRGVAQGSEAPLGSAINFLTNGSFGGFVGPVLQSVKYEANRSWEGETDCTLCGPGKDKSTSRYGALEVGAHYTLRQIPLRLEGFWVPRRVNLSTTHIIESENYKANFASLKASTGARVSWEF
jgi:hypothetical protein